MHPKHFAIIRRVSKFAENSDSMRKSRVLFIVVLIAAFLAAVAVQGGPDSSGLAIIPRPCEIKPGDGEFALNAKTTSFVDPAFGGENTQILEKALKRYLSTPTGFELPTRQKNAATKNAIVILKRAEAKKTGNPGYRLSVTKDKIEIDADNAETAFNAIQTIRQLLPVEIYSPAKVANIKWTIPTVEINDFPRFKWRGLHIDSSRHFFPVEEIEKMLELLAIHKMNIFHWHITDNEAWRLEIKKYPKLTGETARGNWGGRYSEPKFYTQDEVKRIVRFAKERFITVVPEIEMPGHSTAAVASYPEWGAKNAKGEFSKVYNIRDNTIQALKNILDEVVELFPGKYIHCGGDEVQKPWVWTTDPESKAKAAKLGLKDKHAIQCWFMNQIASYLKTKGRTMIGWDEVLQPGLDKDVVLMIWHGKFMGTAPKSGHDVIMAPTSFTYFDHPQAPGDKGMSNSILPWQRVYSFNPTSAVPANLIDKVLGCQGQLWSEFMLDAKRMEYMAFPRVSALSEVQWTPRNKKNVLDFGRRLFRQTLRFDLLKVNYRTPLNVTSDFKNGNVVIGTSIPDAVIRYTEDGTEPTTSSPIYKKPLPDEDKPIVAKAFFGGKTGPAYKVPRAVSLPLTPANIAKIRAVPRAKDKFPRWLNPAGAITWRVRFDKPGKYIFSGEFATEKKRPSVMKLTVGDVSKTFTVPQTAARWKKTVVKIGELEIKHPGLTKIVISVADKKNFGGILLWRIDAKPAGN